MPELPNSLEAAIAQAIEATNTAMADGYSLLQVELILPEIKPMSLAEQFLAEFTGFTQFGSQLKIFFPDAGAAALARRDWGEVPFTIVDVGSGRVPPQVQIQPEDRAFLFIDPSAVEVNQVEKLCEVAGERPVVMLNPRLEDAAIVGIGYAGRQLRDRFLNNIEPCYHLRPLEEDVVVFRCYPSTWQVWREINEEYRLIAEFSKKPSGEDLERLIYGGKTTTETADVPAPNKAGIFASLQQFLRTFR